MPTHCEAIVSVYSIYLEKFIYKAFGFISMNKIKIDYEELSEQTKKDLKEAMEDVKAGRFYTLEEVKKRFGL